MLYVTPYSKKKNPLMVVFTRAVISVCVPHCCIHGAQLATWQVFNKYYIEISMFIEAVNPKSMGKFVWF